MKEISSTKYGKICLDKADNKLIIKKIDYDLQNIIKIQDFDRFFNHDYLCEIYQIRKNENLIIMEYIDGMVLCDIFPFEQRVGLAKAFFKEWLTSLIKIDIPAKYIDLIFLNKLSAIIDICNISQIKEYGLEKLFDWYRIILKRLNTDDLYLLHGDIHNKNLIYTKQGIVKAIDPSPVFGPLNYEYVKFFENELYGSTTDNEFKYKYSYMLNNFAIDLSGFSELLFLDSCYRMWDTLFNDTDNSELNTMKELNERILKEVCEWY